MTLSEVTPWDAAGRAQHCLACENVRLFCEGGGTREDARRPAPELPHKHTECTSFGLPPAYGFWRRRARKPTFHNVEVFAPKDEERLPLAREEVENPTAGGSSNLGMRRSGVLLVFA